MPSSRRSTAASAANAARKNDPGTREKIEGAIECIKRDGTMQLLHEKWFKLKAEPGSAALTIFPGTGTPGYEGYDPKPAASPCG